MILEIESVEKLVEYVDKQLRVLFGETNSIQPFVENALNRAEFCFTNTNNKYYFTGERERERERLSSRISIQYRTQYSFITYHAQST